MAGLVQKFFDQEEATENQEAEALSLLEAGGAQDAIEPPFVIGSPGTATPLPLEFPSKPRQSRWGDPPPSADPSSATDPPGSIKQSNHQARQSERSRTRLLASREHGKAAARAEHALQKRNAEEAFQADLDIADRPGRFGFGGKRLHGSALSDDW